MKAYHTLVFVLCTTVGLAQNLLPNGGFESLINLPVKKNPKNSFQYEPLSGYKPYLFNVKYWFAATKATPDLRITDLNKHRECKKKYPDCNRSKMGIVCTGIMAYQTNETYNAFREYIEIKLLEKLEIGRTVNIEFWVRKEREAKLISNNIGCYLSEKKIYADIEEQLKLKPQINSEEIINEEETKWVKISGKVKIDKEYQFLSIGNFFSNEETKIKKYEHYTSYPSIPPYAYYLVDDVKIWYEGTEPTEAPDPIAQRAKKLEFVEDHIIENLYILFEHDSHVIKQESKPVLDEFLEKLKNSKNKYEIKIIGHTDADGSDTYNLNLSASRAKSVMNYLIRNEVDYKNISSKGFGENRPIVNNDTELNKAKNRRVEIILNKL